MQAPKLIIWDLDGTLWRGTLSEGGAEAIDANLELVRALARRGIPSAIASKNDRLEAMAQLARWQMQDWFVLCRIAWQPKGPAVRWIIEQSRLRAEDVLFIDDEVVCGFGRTGSFSSNSTAAVPSRRDGLHRWRH